MYFYYLPSSISIQNQISVKFNMHQKLYYLNTGKMSKILLKCFQLLWSTFEFTSETMTCTFVSLGKMMSGHLTRILKLKFQRWHVPCPVSSQMLEERTGHARYTGPFRLCSQPCWNRTEGPGVTPVNTTQALTLLQSHIIVYIWLQCWCKLKVLFIKIHKLQKKGEWMHLSAFHLQRLLCWKLPIKWLCVWIPDFSP